MTILGFGHHNIGSHAFSSPGRWGNLIRSAFLASGPHCKWDEQRACWMTISKSIKILFTSVNGLTRGLVLCGCCCPLGGTAWQVVTDYTLTWENFFIMPIFYRTFFRCLVYCHWINPNFTGPWCNVMGPSFLRLNEHSPGSTLFLHPNLPSDHTLFSMVLYHQLTIA